jgi:hypothetical protein
MADKSTPIASLNNRPDDSEVVNQILTKYNTLQDGQSDIPPQNPKTVEMENNFENRNLNQEMYNLKADNVAYNDHHKKEIQRTAQYQKNTNLNNTRPNTRPNNVQQNNVQPNNVEYDDEDEDEDEIDDDGNYEDEYEIIEVPLWKRIINEIRIPLFIFIFTIIISNSIFDKQLIKRVAFFGNQFNECNTYGFLLKAFIIAILSYIFIKFVKI